MAAVDPRGAGGFQRLDVRESGEWAALARAVGEVLGGLDVLVYSAGTLSLAGIASLSPDAAVNAYKVNCLGFLLGMQALTEHLSASPEGGRAIVIGSAAARVGFPELAAYAASKGALHAAVRTLAVELAPRRIRINVLVPSLVRTRMLREELEARAALGEGTPEELLHRFQNSQPLARTTEPEEIAALAVALSDPGFRSLTGAEIPCDGGLLAQ